MLRLIEPIAWPVAMISFAGYTYACDGHWALVALWAGLGIVCLGWPLNLLMEWVMRGRA